MSRGRSAWLVAALVLILARQTYAIQHLGVSRSDRFLLCARTLFGKPVFRATAGFRRSPEIEIPCASSREELLQELRGTSSDVAPQEIKVLETSGLVFLFPSYLWYGGDAWIRWKRLEIPINVRNWDSIPGSRNLSSEEQEKVREAILRDARTVPLATPSMPGRDGLTATIEVMLWLDTHRLAPRAAESVVAILGEKGGAGRLIYGQIREGKYQILWDSPLFDAGDLGIGYRDVDRDGTAEILIWAEAVMGGGPNRMKRLSVWDTKGRELTRQEPCEISPLSGYTREGGACAIQGMSIEIDTSHDGETEFLVRGRPGWYRDADPERQFRYRLVNGRYVVEAEGKKAHKERVSR